MQQLNPSTAVPAEQPHIPVRKSRCRTLSPEELEARRADPQREEDDGVACRICGMVMKLLNCNHFLKHGLKNARAYRQHCQSQGWGSPPIAVSSQQSAQLARRIRACKSAVRRQILRLYEQVPSVRKVAKLVHIDVMVAAAVIREAECMRANGEARRGRPSERSLDRWKVVERRIIERKTTQEIAKELNRRSVGNINRALRSIGWPFTGKRGHSVCHCFGEVFGRAELQRIKQMSDLTLRQLAQQSGVRYTSLVPQVSTRAPGKELAFATARKIAQWWDDLFRRLMAHAPANPRASDEIGQSSIVLAFFPNLRKKYQLLMQVLPRLAEDQQKNLKLLSRHDLQQHLYAQAMLENAGKVPGNLFVEFLPWAPEIIAFLAEKDLRGVDHAPLALEIIARWLRTTETSVTNVMYPSQAKQIREIPPQEMWKLIQDQRALADAEAAKAKLAETEAEVERLRNQPRPEASKPKAPGQESIGNNGKSKRAREKSQLTRAVINAYIDQPEANGASVSRFVDEAGVPPTLKMAKCGMRSFEETWRNPSLKHNLESTYSKIHRGMQKKGAL